MNHTKDTWKIGSHEFTSRFILGSGKYSLDLIKAAVEQAGAEIITLALRRVNGGSPDHYPGSSPGKRRGRRQYPGLYPPGCQSSAEYFRSQRCPGGSADRIKATEILAKEGFTVMPYMYPDLNAARDMVQAGAACIMPLGAPIGSNKGLCTREFIQILIDEIDLPIIVDAGIGRPSQACEAMEMGAAAVMANTAIATAGDVPLMADAFRKAIEAGREAYLSGLGRVMEKGASPSSPLTGYLQD